jgi:hypothetical protein
MRIRWKLLTPGFVAAAGVAAVAFLAVSQAQEGASVSREQDGPTRYETHIQPFIPSDPSPPTDYGRFLLIPYGSPPGDESFVARSGAPIETLTGVTEARQSSLFAMPGYLPDAYALADGVGTVRDGEAIELELTFQGTGYPITIRRMVLRAGDSVPVYLPDFDVPLVVETSQVAGNPAILSFPAPGTKFQLPVTVQFVEKGVLTQVSGRDTPLDEIERVALSLP